jgi:hypothetical protein
VQLVFERSDLAQQVADTIVHQASFTGCSLHRESRDCEMRWT